jgi:hypothetical protein
MSRTNWRRCDEDCSWYASRDCEGCDGNRGDCDGCSGGDIDLVDRVAGGMLDPLADRPWLDLGCGQVCWVCGCTDSRACVTNGVPCHWVEEDLCSACAGMNKGARRRLQRAQARARKADTRRAHKRGLWHGRRY